MNEETPTELINHQSVTLEIPDVGLPTCPKALGRLYFAATVADKMSERIKNHVKQVLMDGGEVEGLFLRRGNRRQQVTDVRAVFEAIVEATGGNVDANEFLRCCKVQMSAVEQLYHMKSPEQLSIAESKKACREVLKPLMATTEGSPVVVFAKPENAQ